MTLRPRRLLRQARRSRRTVDLQQSTPACPGCGRPTTLDWVDAVHGTRHSHCATCGRLWTTEPVTDSEPASTATS